MPLTAMRISQPIRIALTLTTFLFCCCLKASASSAAFSQFGDGSGLHHAHVPLSNSSHPLLARGKCLHNVWRTDPSASLPGKCVGVNPHTEFPALKDIPVSNWADCRALCCNLEQKCTIWQYQNSSNTCYLQVRPVRRGPEGADTPLYCDPYPTHAWHGKHLGERSSGVGDGGGRNNKCTWAWDIPKQCFAFGPERLNNNGVVNMQKGSRMNEAECQQACCDDPECDSWQEYPGRGCYYGKSTCKYEPAEGVYEGGRKCLPGFCGGKEFEKEILGSLKPEELTKLYDLVKWLKDHP